MTQEFEGATEKEAVQNAINTLNIQDFEYEVISETKKGIFKKPLVRIRVILEEDNMNTVYEDSFDDEFNEDDEVVTEAESPEPQSEVEEKVFVFISEILDRIQLVAKPQITARSNTGKLYINLSSPDDSAAIIGYRGERLDALQIIVSSYCLKISEDKNIKVILDVDGYRQKHESKVVREALFVAKKVRTTGKPCLLEPLNSYERRLVHKAVYNFGGVSSESQGNGLMKKIKIYKI